MAGNAHFVNLQDSFLFKAMNMRYENVFLEKAVLMTEKKLPIKNLSRELQNRRRKLSSKHFPIFQDSSFFGFHLEIRCWLKSQDLFSR